MDVHLDEAIKTDLELISNTESREVVWLAQYLLSISSLFIKYSLRIQSIHSVFAQYLLSIHSVFKVFTHIYPPFTNLSLDSLNPIFNTSLRSVSIFISKSRDI